MLEGLFATQFTTAAVIAWFIQRLKKNGKVPFFSMVSDKLNRVVSVLVAAGATVGITGTFEEGVLTVSGITLASVLTFGWNLLTQFVMQEGWYRVVVKDKK